MAFLPLLCVFAAAVAAGAAVEVQRPRGVSLTKRQFYDATKPFVCLDGSKMIPFDRVNDDYCDCSDGSDEPGTSACPNGRFHCTNAGYRPKYILSSRINDGICDCCDATDEYNSGAVCENTCKELGRKEREALKKLAEVAKEGLQIKQQLVEEAKKTKEDKKKKLEEIQESKKSLQMQVELLKAAKENAETLEKGARDKHQKAWEEMKEAKRQEKEKARTVAVFGELDKDADGLVSLSEIQSHSELDGDGDGTFSEAEAQAALGGSNLVDFTTFRDVIWVNIRDKYKSEIPEGKPPMVSEEEAGAGMQPEQEKAETHFESDDDDTDDDGDEEDDDDDIDDDHEDHDDEEEEEYEDDHLKVPVGKPGTSSPETDEERMPDYDEETQALVDAAEDARDKFKTAEKSLQESEDGIRNLEKELSLDLGPNDEFAYMFGNCYELTNEYIYRLCPFEKVTQKPKRGGIETSLGIWGSWAGPEDNKYSIMKYEDGTSCWQGPNRSTKVKLVCSKETVLTSCTEPSRCEYLMVFQTPAMCEEPQAMPAEHDEL